MQTISMQGYKQKRAYIATQVPLESTVIGFWKMVWEQKPSRIVLLAQPEERDKAIKQLNIKKDLRH